MGEENKTQKEVEIAPPQTISQTNQTKKHRSLYIVLSVLLLLTVGVGVYGYFVNKDDSDLTQQKSATKVWVTYKNPELGLKFNYPKLWGEVSISERAAKTGKTYSINFDKQNLDPSARTPLNTSVTLFFETNDLVKKFCETDQASSCKDTPGFSAKDIQTALNTKPNKFVASDKESYATVDNSDKKVSILLVNQTVTLPKINVSAVTGKYYIVKVGDKPKQCPDNQLATVNQESCISQSAYIDLNKTLKSVSGI